MKKHKKITMALAVATSSLMSVTPDVHAEESADIGDWDIDAAVLYYTESDRVSAFEPVISAKKQIDTDESISLKLTLDSLTGPSANGAVPSINPQTFTKPSGNNGYTTSANETPLDDTFKDTRIAFNASWEQALTRMTRLTLGGNISNEYDYLSLGLSAVVAHDINQRNTTFTTGVSFANDTIDPEGGLPIAFGVMQPSGTLQPRQTDSDDKTIFDVLFGVTQIIDKDSLFQVNYSYSQADGYLTDPFKVISVVDGVTGLPIIEDATTNLSQVVYENRPDSRAKHSVFTQYKRNIIGDVLDVSYRYMFDDWDINSHTLDFRYRLKTSETTFWQPHLRYYQQSEADFFRPYFISGQHPGEGTDNVYATSDYRLGEMTTYTVGLEYGEKYHDHGWSISGEFYLQSISEPTKKVGQLVQQELYPDVDAFMLRFSYDF